MMSRGLAVFSSWQCELMASISDSVNLGREARAWQCVRVRAVCPWRDARFESDDVEPAKGKLVLGAEEKCSIAGFRDQ